MWYCGWDGGGTKTEVCITNEKGSILAERIFGPLNPNGTDIGKVRETVREAVELMCAQPGSLEACGGLVIGVAGMSSLNTAAVLKEALRAAGWNGRYCMMGDHEIALAGAIEGYGAILIAGTGAVCYGRDPDGKCFRIGGYGYLIDDVGSGYAIGRDILSAVVRAADGREDATLLMHLVADRLGTEKGDMQALVTWLYAPETGKKEIAALASLLPEALDAGDAAAGRIAEKAAEELAELVLTGWKTTGMRDGELAFAGSILQKILRIRDSVERRIHECFPEIQIMDPLSTPARGAARLAREKFSGAED